MNGRFSPSLNKPQTSETRLVATVIHYAPSNLDLCSYLEGPAKASFRDLVIGLGATIQKKGRPPV